MRLTDKKALEAFLKLRETCFKQNIEDVPQITSLIKETIAKFDKVKKISPHLIYTLCHLIHHYREVVFFSRSKFDNDLINEARQLLLKESAKEENITIALVNYTIALSYVPFVRGDVVEVYTHLLQGDGFNDYFDGIKKALQYFEASDSIDIPVHLRAMEDIIRTQSYKVWMEYCRNNHLSDLIYFYFLNSDLQFKELVTLNDSYMKEIVGLGDEWREK